MIQTAPAGIASATQQSQLHTAGENIHLVSGNHTDISAGQSLTAHAVESLNLFAQSQGIKVQANQGAVTVQAQNDELQLNALKDATLTSSAGKITIAAKEEILITCKGAYIKLSNGEVEIGSPKVVGVRAPLVVGGSDKIIYKMPMFNQISKNCLIKANKERSLYVSFQPKFCRKRYRVRTRLFMFQTGAVLLLVRKNHTTFKILKCAKSVQQSKKSFTI